jgi:hypothetical protein
MEVAPELDEESRGHAVYRRTVDASLNLSIVSGNWYQPTVAPVRRVQAEYLLTLLPNGVNSRQNNFNLTTGIVIRFGAR